MIADTLLDDGRVERLENRLRAEFPRLPESSELVAYVQEPLEVEHRGIVRIVEAVVFGIRTQNPRRPRLAMLHKTSMHLSQWRQLESSFRRIVDYPDPAYHAFRRLVPQVIDWYETTRDLDGPTLDFEPTPEDAVLHGA